jgi:hypothetical protein
MRTISIRLGWLCAGALFTLPLTSVAEAAWQGSADLGLNLRTGDIEEGDLAPHPGLSLGLGLGYAFDLGLVSLTPEVALAYERPWISGTAGYDTVRADILRPMAGGRAALELGLVKPSVFAHAGYALVSEPNSTLNRFTYQIGAGLDFKLLPPFGVGIFASYNHVINAAIITHDSGVASFELGWLVIGARAVIEF